jgi:alpha-tubulin suppressor-like RCC1 family protein
MPFEVKGLDDAVAISSGDLHACAFLESRRMVCWGNNEYDQLGPGMPVQDAPGTVI